MFMISVSTKPMKSEKGIEPLSNALQASYLAREHGRKIAKQKLEVEFYACYHYTNPTETPSFLKASGRRCYLRGKWDRGFEHPFSSLTWIINFRTALPFYFYYVCCSLCFYAKDSKGLDQSIQGYSLQPLYFCRVRRHRSACTV